MSRLADAPLIQSVFSGLVTLPALALGIASLVVLNKGNDPVRRGFRWLAFAALSLFVYALFVCVMNAMNEGTGFSFEVAMGLSAGGGFARNMAHIQLLFVILDLVSGHLLLWNRAPRLQKTVRWGSYGAVAVLYVLSLTIFIGYLTLDTSYFLDENSTRHYSKIFRASNFLLLALHNAALVLCVYVLRVAKKVDHKGQTPVLLLIAASFVWARTIFVLASDIVSMIPIPKRSFLAAASEEWWNMQIRRNNTYIAESFAEMFLPLAAIAVLYAAGKRRQGGLWSAESAADAAAVVDTDSDVEKQQQQSLQK
ncbi:hypothetical protein Micbo1qcDRAFT_215912 [Microdochium bolleyi]|uniref:Uncharacterized protein n=1 Tax=Microdochium bolleyi TaxID=196109 RepID=A0A136IRR5_9PEZI|nr:hypothetical protein Micbo1qcDRAFT_215912 [Microdochium bolleyi]